MLLNLAFILCLCSASCFAVLTCRTYPKTQPLPGIVADFYHYKVQINIPGLNKTFSGFEYNDNVNKIRLFRIKDQSGTVETYVDYANNQTYTVTDNGDCTVKNLTRERISLFGLGIENGPLNVNPSFLWNDAYQAFKFNQPYNGISSDGFSTCRTFLGGSIRYIFQILFSKTTWTMPDAQNAPVVFHLLASEKRVGSPVTHRLYVYRFSEFSTTQLPNIRLPADILCLGRRDLPAPLPSNATIPTRGFHLAASLFSANPRFRIFFREDVDFAGGLFRYDSGTTRTIHNFRQGLDYTIDTVKETCSIATIPRMTPFIDVEPVTVNGKETVQIRNPGFFWLTLDPVYGGMLIFNDVLVQAWIAQKPLVTKDFTFGGTIAYVFITNYMRAGVPFPESFIGVKQRHVVTKNGVNQTFEIIGTVHDRHERIDVSLFDTSVCLSPKQKEIICMKFKFDVYEEVAKDPAAFKKALVAATAKAASVGQYRIDPHITFKLSGKGHEPKYFIVFITILGVPDVKGHSVGIEPQICLSTAVKKLQAKLDARKFKVEGFHNEPEATPCHFKKPRYHY